MAEHIAEISWQRETAGFAYDDYNRTHEWRFDNGAVVKAAAAPAFLGDPACVDPEEAFVASIASCHMLTFLAICARKRIIVDMYKDHATGVMTKNDAGKLWVSGVTLRPRVTFSDDAPLADEQQKLHHMAHKECFIANSVMTEIITHLDV